MKTFNNLPERLKMQKEVLTLAENISKKYSFYELPVNYIIVQSVKKVYSFPNKYGNPAYYTKERNEFVECPFAPDIKLLKQYPLKQLFTNLFN